MSNEPRLDEQALSLAAEMTLSSQLDEAEKIDVDVRTDLPHLVQGHVDSVTIEGHGLVMQKDIRVEEMELHTDSLDINPLSALFGHIELNHPVDATTRLVLTEQDINRALNSNYVQSKMQHLELKVDGQPVSLEMQHMELLLPSVGKMIFNGDTLIHAVGKTRPISFTAIFRPRTLSQPVMIEGCQCIKGEGLSLEETVALMQKLKELVNLPYFELEGMALRVKDMEVQTGRLTLHTEVHVNKIPSS